MELYMTKEILIKIKDDKTSIAISEEGKLMEIYLASANQQNLFGNIYLGKVENVLPGMQAAFIDIGVEKNSFLYVDDALSTKEIADPALRSLRNKEKDINISQVLKEKDQVVVQIFKEPIGSKGARVTMKPSLPGRYVVLLPRGDYIAVSRRITDEKTRNQLKELVANNLPPNMGVIVRTVAEDTTDQLIIEDINSLVVCWQHILASATKAKAPSLLYGDASVLHKVIRDTSKDNMDRIVTANRQDYDIVAKLCQEIAPALLDILVLQDSDDLFSDYDIYSQMERALQRKVWLKSGGYIIFDQAEALTVIDVNTGKYIGEDDLGQTVLTTNMEAVTEIARQLRLRNIGGIIIIDFIDIDDAADKKKLMTALAQQMDEDRVRITIMGMTQLGLVEMTRKKVGHSLSAAMEKQCPECNGKGLIVNDTQDQD
jgi:ribonuclease G